MLLPGWLADAEWAHGIDHLPWVVLSPVDLEDATEYIITSFVMVWFVAEPWTSWTVFMWSVRSICEYENDCLAGMVSMGQSCCEIIRLSKSQSLSNVKRPKAKYSPSISSFLLSFGCTEHGKFQGLIALALNKSILQLPRRSRFACMSVATDPWDI